MKIHSLLDDEVAKENYKQTCCSKFAVLLPENDEGLENNVLLVFPAMLDHIVAVKKWLRENGLQDNAGAHFVGAGSVEGEDVEWGSGTCSKEFNRDRPIDPDAARACLEAVREQILDWLQGVPV